MHVEYCSESSTIKIHVGEKTYELDSKFDAFRKMKHLKRTSQIDSIDEECALKKIFQMEKLPLENAKVRDLYTQFSVFKLGEHIPEDGFMRLYSDIDEESPVTLVFKINETNPGFVYGRFYLGEKISRKVLCQNDVNEYLRYFSEEHIANAIIREKIKQQVKNSRLPKKSPKPLGKKKQDN